MSHDRQSGVHLSTTARRSGGSFCSCCNKIVAEPDGLRRVPAAVRCFALLLLAGLLTTSLFAQAVPDSASQSNAVVWTIEPEKLPEWGASPDNSLVPAEDESSTEFELEEVVKDDKTPDSGIRIAPTGIGEDWHGRVLERTLEIYEDFTIEWDITWNQISVGAVCSYSLDFGIGSVGLGDQWPGKTAEVFGQVAGVDLSLTVEPETELTGQARFRVERRNGIITAYRDGQILFSRKALGAVTAIQLKDEVFRTTSNTEFATKRLSLLLPSCREKPVLNDDDKVSLQAVRSMDQTEGVDISPLIVPIIYTDRSRFEAQIDLLHFDLDRCSDAGLRKEYESSLTKLGKQGMAFFETMRSELDRIQYEAGMILQGSSGKDSGAVIGSGKKWQTTYAEGKERLANALAAMREELKPFAMTPDDWWKKQRLHMDNRAWIRDSFMLKHENHYGLVPPGYEEAVGLMAEMGCNCLSGTPVFRRHPVDELTPDQLKGVYDAPTRYGVRAAPMFGYAVGEKMTPSTGLPDYPSGWVDWADQGNIEKMKRWIACVIEESTNYPAFAGIHLDEICYLGGWSKANIQQFRAYLKGKYSGKELADLGIADVDAVLPPTPEERLKEKVLFMEHREWVAHVFETGFSNLCAYAWSLKPDCLMLPLLSPGPSFHNAPFSASLARVSQIGDSIQIDPYMNGAIDEAYICDVVRNSGDKPMCLTVGTHYGGNVRTLRRDYAIAVAHADGLFVFDWPFIYKSPPITESWRAACKEGAWEATLEAFGDAKKLEPYLLHTIAETDVATLHSERTASFDSYRHDAFHGRGGIYHREQVGLYSALTQSHTPVAPVFAETITIERLRKYRVLILADARCLDDSEVKLVTDWTEEGGFLIVTGGSLLLDRWGRELDDYRLANVMGLEWLSTGSGFTNWTFNADADFLGGHAVSYRSEFKWDEVKLTTAGTLAEWSNGKPAVTLNTFGKGHCCFVSAHRLGSCCEWVVNEISRCPYAKDFDDGVREFLDGLVKWALHVQGRERGFELENCPESTEVTLRAQPGAGRRMLHFLNYHEVSQATGIKVKWRLPDKSMKVFYAADGKVIEPSTTGDAVEFTLRDLGVHEVVVAEPVGR